MYLYVNTTIKSHLTYSSDVEIVGQPVSLADRKFLTSQKVLTGSSLLYKFALMWFVTNYHFGQKI